MKKIPLIVTAFGTTTQAAETYDRMDTVFKAAFPDHPLFWAFSSRMVKAGLQKRKGRTLKDPVQVMADLAAQGHDWVVLQSLHLIWGHEFDRLSALSPPLGLRRAMGLPLLTTPVDYQAAARALNCQVPHDPGQAVVWVGHGTDHPAWSTYPALEAVLRQVHGPAAFVGVVEGHPGLALTLDRVRAAGFDRVCLVPLMLVAGVHFQEDLTVQADSWQKTFENAGIGVTVVNQGIGLLDSIVNIFCDHMAAALDVIPIKKE
jgi:sirohydrochlorin cobaltochelatase